ncbi:MAG: hypothetical protein PHV47_01115 [Candidatus Pacebacteria bacterium]|nr:hypothetical protein [Candidatus Paceibacterota bacterium]
MNKKTKSNIVNIEIMILCFILAFIMMLFTRNIHLGINLPIGWGHCTYDVSGFPFSFVEIADPNTMCLNSMNLLTYCINYFFWLTVFVLIFSFRKNIIKGLISLFQYRRPDKS